MLFFIFCSWNSFCLTAFERERNLPKNVSLFDVQRWQGRSRRSSLKFSVTFWVLWSRLDFNRSKWMDLFQKWKVARSISNCFQLNFCRKMGGLHQRHPAEEGKRACSRLFLPLISTNLISNIDCIKKNEFGKEWKLCAPLNSYWGTHRICHLKSRHFSGLHSRRFLYRQKLMTIDDP